MTLELVQFVANTSRDNRTERTLFLRASLWANPLILFPPSHADRRIAEQALNFCDAIVVPAHDEELAHTPGST